MSEVAVPAWEGKIPPSVPPQRAPEVFFILEELRRTPIIVNPEKPVSKPYCSLPPEKLLTVPETDRLTLKNDN